MVSSHELLYERSLSNKRYRFSIMITMTEGDGNYERREA